MKELLINATDILNSYSLVEIFDLEKQFDCKYAIGTSGVEVQAYDTQGSRGKKLGKILIPLDLIGSDEDKLYICSNIILEVLRFMAGLCEQDDHIDYVTNLLGSFFDIQNISQDEVHSLLNVIFEGEFSDIVNGYDRQWNKVISTTILSYLIEGITLDSGYMFKSGQVLRKSIGQGTIRKNPEAKPKQQYIKNLLGPGLNIYRFEVLAFQFWGNAPQNRGSNTVPLSMGQEIISFDETFYMSVTNNLIAKYFGRIMCMPIVFESELQDLDGKISVPRIEIKNFYPSKGKQVSGFVDVRQILNLDYRAYLQKITTDLNDQKLLIANPQRKEIDNYLKKMLGFGQNNPKTIEFRPNLVRSGDDCVDSFEFNGKRFDLPFIYISVGLFDRPVVDKRNIEDYQKIIINRDFLMMETKVSQDLFFNIMSAIDSKLKGSYKKDIAITGISWLDAANFCNMLSILVGLDPVYIFDVKDKQDNTISSDLVDAGMLRQKISIRSPIASKSGYRLPTETEWEFVALAGLDSGYTLGGDYADEQEASKYLDIPKMNRKLSNDINLYDKEPNNWGFRGLMAGDGEFCTDVYKVDIYNMTNLPKEHVHIHPVSGGGPEEFVHDLHRVVKGNSTDIKSIQDLSLFNRFSLDPKQAKLHNVGFRICRNIS